MDVVLRYVDKRGLILERLVGVVHVKETSTTCLKSALQKKKVKNLSKKVKNLSKKKSALQKFFVDIGLSLKQVRGQCYDGASNMRGEFNGLKEKNSRGE
jgi:hypothetical protein